MSFNRSAIGILMTLLTIMFGVITGLCVRSVGDAAPLITVLMYRFVCSIPLLLLLALAVRGRQFLQVNARRTLMVRIAFGCAAMTLWFTSLRLLPLGQATALFQSSVIFVTIFSPLMLGERIGIYRWSAVVTGMIGIVLLTNPFDVGFSFNVVFGVGGAMAGVAGILWGILFGSVTEFTGFLPGIKAFSAAVVGGIGNLGGAMAGGLTLGSSESLAPQLVLEPLGVTGHTQLKDAVAFLVLIFVLLVKPTGLFGERLSAEDRA